MRITDLNRTTMKRSDQDTTKIAQSSGHQDGVDTIAAMKIAAES